MKSNPSTAFKLSSLRTKHTATLDELEKYRLLVESVQDYAIFLLDPSGIIQTWNAGARKIKGYTDDEIIGKHFSIFYRQEDKNAHKPERELQLAQKNGRVEDEGWRVRKDGGQFWANVVITPLYDTSHTLIAYAKVTRDLTERKKHEDEFRHANVILRKQQKEVERLNTLKDEFISLASHQLRTPATSIKQLLGMLLEGFVCEVPVEIAPYIEKAYISNERQISIVNNLLKVAQLDAGKVTLQKSPVVMTALLQEVADEYQDVFRRRKQAIVVATDDLSGMALIDKDYFQMAIENLIDNASKYTPESGTISLSVRSHGDTMTVSITDDGVGIPPQAIGKLFQKFVRIPNELSNRAGGSGLGLYWVNKVVELHGGRISVQSALNKGTTFQIVLPSGA